MRQPSEPVLTVHGETAPTTQAPPSGRRPCGVAPIYTSRQRLHTRGPAWGSGAATCQSKGLPAVSRVDVRRLESGVEGRRHRVVGTANLGALGDGVAGRGAELPTLADLLA